MKKIRALLLVLLLMVVAPPAYGSIVGDSVSIEWAFPVESTSFFSQTVVVPGAVFPGYGISSVSIGDGTVTVDNGSPAWAGSSGFN